MCSGLSWNLPQAIPEQDQPIVSLLAKVSLRGLVVDWGNVVYWRSKRVAREGALTVRSPTVAKHGQIGHFAYRPS